MFAAPIESRAFSWLGWPAMRVPSHRRRGLHWLPSRGAPATDGHRRSGSGQLRHGAPREPRRGGCRFELVEGDVQSYERVHTAVRGCDTVLHQAALPSVPRSVQDPLTSHASNVTGTLNVLLAARDSGVRRVVFASSSSVYGANPELPKHEELTPLPISPYAVAKLAGENYCRRSPSVYGLETVALRYFNVFGPRQDPLSQYAAVIPNFITAALQGRRPTIFGDGEQSRDFSYIDNVVEANLLAAATAARRARSYNIACGERITLNRLLVELGACLRHDYRRRLFRAETGRGQALAGGHSTSRTTSATAARRLR